MFSSLRRWFSSDDESSPDSGSRDSLVIWAPPVPRRLQGRDGVTFPAQQMDDWVALAAEHNLGWTRLVFSDDVHRLLDVGGPTLLHVLLGRTEIHDARRISPHHVEVKTVASANREQVRMLAISALYDFAVASGMRTGDTLHSEYNSVPLV